MNKQPCVYLLASKRNGTLYIGVTSNLIKHVYEHRTNAVEGFTKRYNVHTLVWYEQHDMMESAILREKQLKKWHRSSKILLIEKDNPEWKDLWLELTLPSIACMDAGSRATHGAVAEQTGFRHSMPE